MAAVDGETGDDGHASPVYLARLPNGPLMVLKGSAAVIWRVAVGDSDSPGEEVVEGVASATGVGAGEIREEVTAFLAELVAQGLLEPGVPDVESTAPPL